jgi:CHAT domain-containing protein
MLAVFADPVFDPQDPRVASARNKMTGLNATLVLSSVNKDLMRSATSVTRAGFSKLPFSRKEAEAIAAYSPPTRLLFATGFKANRQTAISEALAKYRIIHFATHGLLNNDRPELSGLVLSLVNENGLPQDGFLRMADIYNQHLRKIRNFAARENSFIVCRIGFSRNRDRSMLWLPLSPLLEHWSDHDSG